MGPRRRVLKNAAAEANQFRLRSAIAFTCVLLALAGLGLWYFRLQVWQHADYATRSEANRIKLRPVVPGRGHQGHPDLRDHEHPGHSTVLPGSLWSQRP